MNEIPTIGCGTCVFYAMWHKFPPTNSWVVIFPIWFIWLSAIRTISGKRIRAIPALYIAIPLVLAVYLVAPAMVGPPVGFWVPVCCFVAGWTELNSGDSSLKRVVIASSVFAIIALFGFGVRDFHQYNQMSQADKDKFTPTWEATKTRRSVGEQGHAAEWR